jgi:hypothetical protein
MEDKSKNNDKLTTLFLLFVVYQLVLHLLFGLKADDPRLILPTLISFLHDIVILGTITIVGKTVSSFVSSKFKTTINQSFNILLIICGVLLAFYPKMLREYLVFPINIFDADLSSTETLLTDYLGLSAIIPSLIALMLGVVVLMKNVKLRSSKKTNIAVTVIIVLILGFTLQRPSPQPFMYSIQKKGESIISGKKRVVQSLNRTTKASSTLKKIQLLEFSTKAESHYNHILLIVLEGITSETFEKGFLTISNGFYEQNKNNSVYYENYYASNLDSYTSLISMLTSVQVPYRAYADETLYDKVNEAPSITEDFKNKGFENIFVSCYEYQPFVPTRKHWDKIYERKDLPSIDQWLSLGSNKMESATEDKAAISTIVANMKSNNKSFILHELVYGHSPEWRATTGKTQNIYHNEYLLDLSNQLKQENLFDSTLFIIVSDHGNRAKSAEIENYRIPLLIVGKNISESTNNELLTNLDIPRIIYHYTYSDNHPKSRNELYFIGSTEKWVYGKMLKNKENVFIDDATGTILYQSGDLKAEKVREEFQNYLNVFNEKYGK